MSESSEAMPDGEIAKLLASARALIADPGNWTVRQMARNATGRPIKPNSPRAVCFCAIGAVAHVRGKTGEENYDPVGRRACDELDRAAISLCGGRVVGRADDTRPAAALNDDGDHAAVLRMFNVAIARIEDPEQKNETGREV